MSHFSGCVQFKLSYEMSLFSSGSDYNQQWCDFSIIMTKLLILEIYLINEVDCGRVTDLVRVFVIMC